MEIDEHDAVKLAALAMIASDEKYDGLPTEERLRRASVEAAKCYLIGIFIGVGIFVIGVILSFAKVGIDKLLDK